MTLDPGRGSRCRRSIAKVESGRSPNRHLALAVFAGINALAAWFGAMGLISGFLALPPELADRLPFGSPVLGGLALAAIVAVPLTLLAWCAATGDGRTAQVAELTGGLLVAWILVQVVILRSFSAFQPVYVVFGVVLVVWAHRIKPRSSGPDV